jgi:hypothetical protein
MVEWGMSTGSALLALEDAYDEATWGWPADSVDEILGPLEDLGTEDAGTDGYGRALVEEASPFGLVARLQDAPMIAAPSRLDDTLDLLRAAERLASWAAAQRARLVARVTRSVIAGTRAGRAGRRHSRSRRRSRRPRHC